MKEERVQRILATIANIEMSDLSVNNYFTVHDVPFSRSQYYTYCHILKHYGEEGLRDKRHAGNNTKLTQRIEDYMLFTLKQEPEISTQDLRHRVEAEFATMLSKSRVNMFRSVHGYTGTRPTKRIPHAPQCSGGGEMVTGLALCSGILDVFTHTIKEQIQEIRQSDAFRHNQQKPKDHPDIRTHGKFTTAYNQLQSVRENRFKSIDEKISHKNYAAMNLFRLSEKSLSRYHLALLCLPLVTSNGKLSRVNRVRGNDLTFLCGYNYKDATLDKYLREVKYLKIAEKLVAETAKFWMRFWKERYNEETFFACYYIDGNTKALWSSERHYKGKVTMLGRVMNCLENVFIHDGKGHPLYFQTFHGHADLGKHALAMLTELSNLGDESATVTRILVIDGAGNSVKMMRAFQQSEEYFITILDKNQVNERRVKHLGADQPYPYGDATLSECRIELQDSSESGYLYESRAVMVKWAHGRQAVLVTNIPGELLEASEVVKHYFDRWPMQEKQFRDAKNGVHIHRIVGYGKRAEPYEKMRGKCQKLREAIRHLQAKLHAPLAEIARLDEELAMWYAKERPLREQSTIEDGERILCEAKLAELKQCERHINACLRKKRAIKKPYKADFKQFHDYLKEEARLCRKETVYRLDTELDQIMTCFKLSFVNLCSLFLTECLNHETFELLTLFESIFHLDGQALITETEKIITLQPNPKEPELMKKLELGLRKLNEMNIINHDGLQLKFGMRVV